jgi:hypothetical protein
MTDGSGLGEVYAKIAQTDRVVGALLMLAICNFVLSIGIIAHLVSLRRALGKVRRKRDRAE